MHQNKMQDQAVHNVLDINRIKFKSYGNYQSYFKSNEIIINNQDPQNQNPNDETSKAEHPNRYDSEDIEINTTSAIPNFKPKLLPDNGLKKV